VPPRKWRQGRKELRLEATCQTETTNEPVGMHPTLFMSSEEGTNGNACRFAKNPVESTEQIRSRMVGKNEAATRKLSGNGKPGNGTPSAGSQADSLPTALIAARHNSASRLVWCLVWCLLKDGF